MTAPRLSTAVALILSLIAAAIVVAILLGVPS